MDHKPFIVACIPAYNEERTIVSVVVRAMKHVDKAIVCDGGSGDLMRANKVCNRLNKWSRLSMMGRDLY